MVDSHQVGDCYPELIAELSKREFDVNKLIVELAKADKDNFSSLENETLNVAEFCEVLRVKPCACFVTLAECARYLSSDSFDSLAVVEDAILAAANQATREQDFSPLLNSILEMLGRHDRLASRKAEFESKLCSSTKAIDHVSEAGLDGPDAKDQNSNSPIIKHFDRAKLIGVPELIQDYYPRPEVEAQLCEKLKDLCNKDEDEKNGLEGALLVYGQAGIGKTTLLVQIVQKQSRFLADPRQCNIQVIIWLNCYQWRHNFDEGNFIRKLSDVVTSADSETVYDYDFLSIDSIISHFSPRNVLFILEDVFNIELALYFRQQCPDSSSVCFTSSNKNEFDNWQTGRSLKLIQHVFEVPPLSKEEIPNFTSIVYGKEVDQENLSSIIPIGYCLPLLVKLAISRWNLRLAAEAKSNSTKKDIVQANFVEPTSPIDAFELFDQIIDELSKEDRPYLRKLFYALLLWEPAEVIQLGDLCLAWGIDIDQTVQLCSILENSFLVTRIATTSPNDSSIVVHQTIHEIALVDAAKREGILNFEKQIDNLQMLRFIIVAGVCTYSSYFASQQKNDTQRTKSGSFISQMKQKIDNIFAKTSTNPVLSPDILFKTLQTQNRNFLEKIIEKVDGSHWPSLCKMKIVTPTGGTISFALYLFIFDWKDDVNSEETRTSKKKKHSHRLLAKILLKARQSSIKAASEICEIQDDGKPLSEHIFNMWPTWKGNLDFNQLFCLADPQKFVTWAGHSNLIYDNAKEAAMLGDVDALRQELKKGGFDVAFLMKLAAQFGRANAVRFLCEADANGAERASSGRQTPISLAATFGHCEVVKLLYDRFPKSISLRDSDNRQSPLSLAARNGHFSVVRFLYEKYPKAIELTDKNGLTPLCWALLGRHIKVALFLYENYPGAVELPGKEGYGRSPLSCAAESGDFEMVKFLYEKHPDAVKYPDSIRKRTPLAYAVESGRLECIEFFYEKFPGAVELQDELGRTPLIWAVIRGNLETVKFIYQRFEKAIGTADTLARMPLSWAAIKGDPEVAMFLYSQFPSAIEQKDAGGQTALSLAAEYGNLDVVKFLFVKFQQALHMKDKDGKTPIDWAMSKGHGEILRFLQSNKPMA